jgi:hypothetical protein
LLRDELPLVLLLLARATAFIPAALDDDNGPGDDGFGAAPDWPLPEPELPVTIVMGPVCLLLDTRAAAPLPPAAIKPVPELELEENVAEAERSRRTVGLSDASACALPAPAASEPDTDPASDAELLRLGTVAVAFDPPSMCSGSERSAAMVGDEMVAAAGANTGESAGVDALDDDGDDSAAESGEANPAAAAWSAPAAGAVGCECWCECACRL